MKFGKPSISALVLSSVLMMSGSPAYSAPPNTVPTINIMTDPMISYGIGNGPIQELINQFILNGFCELDVTCHIVPQELIPFAGVVDQVVSAQKVEDVQYDLVLSTNSEPSDLYNSQLRRFPHYPDSKPMVVGVGKPFQFASDSVVLYSMFPGPGIDVSSGFPKHLDEGEYFAIADPIGNAYGAVTAQILSTLPNFKSVLKHAQDLDDGFGAWLYVWTPLDDPYIHPRFGFAPKSLVFGYAMQFYPTGTSVYEFSKQENLKAINSIKLTGVTIGKNRSKEEEALLQSFIRYLTGQDNGNGQGLTAAAVLKSFYYVPITEK